MNVIIYEKSKNFLLIYQQGDNTMKKITALTLALIIGLTCSVFLFSCGGTIEDKIVGTYSMTDVSGTLTVNGETTPLSTDLYEKYEIILNKDGSAKIIAAAVNSVESEQEGTWKYEEGKLKITNELMGTEVTEIMEWNDNVITYENKQSEEGVEVSVKLTLKKK